VQWRNDFVSLSQVAGEESEEAQFWWRRRFALNLRAKLYASGYIGKRVGWKNQPTH
jgi:hypothetical protein